MTAYAHRHEVTVSLRDTDGVGHANNAAIVTFLENARDEYLMGRRGLERLDQVDFMLARTEIDYRSPAFLHQRLEVLVRPLRVGTKSFDLEYLVREVGTRRVVAEARTVQVSYDFGKRASREVPDTLRQLLTQDIALEEEP
jgi:acyl-CoA thioester hydrolase